MEARRDKTPPTNSPSPSWYQTRKGQSRALLVLAALIVLYFTVRWVRSDDKKDQVAETTNGTAGQATVTIPLAEYEQLKADAAQGKTVAATPRVPQLGQVGAMPTPIPTDPCLYHILGAPRPGESYTVVDAADGKTQIITKVVSVDVIPKQ